MHSPATAAAMIPVRYLLVRVGDVRRLVALDGVDWIEAHRNRVLLHVGQATFPYPSTLHDMELALDPQAFLRLNRSTIVRLGSIRELQPWFHGDHIVVLRDGTKLTLSRSHTSVLDRFRVGPGRHGPREPELTNRAARR